MQGEQLSAFLQCLKQLGNSQSPRDDGLKGEYNTLSKGYKLAQERILQLQSSLFEQTMFSERQNSVIDLLKQALTGDMDDPSILSFIKSLQQDLGGDPTLTQTITEIQRVLENRERKGIIEKQGRIVQIGIKCQELQSSVVHLAEKVETLQVTIRGKDQQITQLSSQLQQSRASLDISNSRNRELEERLAHLKEQVKDKEMMIENRNQQIELIKQAVQEYTETITSCEENWRQSQSHSKLLSVQLGEVNSILQSLQPILGEKSQMKSRLQKLVRSYRYLKLKQTEGKENHKTLFNSIKQFLSFDALGLVKEIQQNISSTYLYKELQDLAELQKEQLAHYQSQDRELKRCKLELIRAQEGDTIFTSREMSGRMKNRDLERTGKFNETSQFKL